MKPCTHIVRGVLRIGTYTKYIIIFMGVYTVDSRYYHLYYFFFYTDNRHIIFMM